MSSRMMSSGQGSNRSAASNVHNLDTQSAQVEFGSPAGVDMSSAASSKIMENYLILDRLNKKQQRKQQQLKLKQLQHQQQLNELRQRQLEYEAQLVSNQNDGAAHDSKLTAHYIIPSGVKTAGALSASGANLSSAGGVSNLRLALQQQLSQQQQQQSLNRYNSLAQMSVMASLDQHGQQINSNVDLNTSSPVDHPETYQFVQVSEKNILSFYFVVNKYLIVIHLCIDKIYISLK